MADLFTMEAKEHVEIMIAGLLELERTPDAAQHLEACMRAAHSLKGAARIVGLEPGVAVARALEDCFVRAQGGSIRLASRHVDLLLHGIDILARIAQPQDGEASVEQSRLEVDAFVAALRAGTRDSGNADAGAPLPPATNVPALRFASPSPIEHGLRVSADDLHRLLGVAAESLIQSRRIKPYRASLLALKRQHNDARRAFGLLSDVVRVETQSETAARTILDLQSRLDALATLIAAQLDDVDAFDHRTSDVAHRLYEAALACRMRPLADGIVRLPRLVRDLAQLLGKDARLEVSGASTRLDREILEKLESPLVHLLSNALDHGIESPQERERAGKPASAVVRLEASHSAGMLHVTISDDGHGIDVESLRSAIVERHLITPENARALSEADVLQFLFLPGFTTKPEVTDVSGRGIGLDVVYTMLKEVGGKVNVTSTPGRGARFTLTLPLSLSVVRTLLVEIDGEPYAFPLAHIVRTLALEPEQIESIEGRRFFRFAGAPVALVDARDVFNGATRDGAENVCFAIVLGTQEQRYGLAVDRFLGERELVIAGLDARLGKIKNIAAGALMEDGSPILIADVDDLLNTMEILVSRAEPAHPAERLSPKRVLVVEDSLTIRQLQRRLLDDAGYEVEVAVNGMDGWNAVRAAHFDLVVTDVDMPRMDGIELATKIKSDRHLCPLAVIVVSYKDRDEDRRRAFEAGAAFFISKSELQDTTFLRAVTSCIGAAAA